MRRCARLIAALGLLAYLHACEISNSFSSDKSLVAAAGQSGSQSAKLMGVLQRNCTSCHYHDSFFDYQNDEQWMAGDYGHTFTPGNASESIFYQRIENDSMPPSGSPMSDADKAMIRNWIDGMPK